MGFADKLQPASFRGVSFLVNTESVERGKKVVLHEYPNSDNRFVEELGKLPPIFSVEAIIHGEDALNHRLRLENVLEITGLGKLIHPVYGELDVTSLDFSVSSNQTAIGEVRFSIRFAQSRANISPAPSVTNETAVTQKAAAVRSALDSVLEEKYIPPETTLNFTTITEKATELWTSIQEKINANVVLSSEGAATFNRVVRTSIGNVFSVVQSGASLKNAISLIIDSALNTGQVPQQLDASWNSLTGESLLPIGNTNTVEQLQREKNNALLTEHLRLTSLANSYESKVYTDFTTDDELESAKAFLDRLYIEYLLQIIDELKELNLNSLTEDQTVRDTFADLRDTAREVFDDKEKTVFRVAEITPRKTSMALTAYRYYGDLTKIDLLTDLNPDINHANFNEEIKVLSN
ncbi:MAG: DNA circularization N-terminal domain-containing protein [Candidatus Peribacteraceae bacterium]|nr:DNA circularization N-terminal domain-containing protein [Candidatus Peribacteraceae bacterium]